MTPENWQKAKSIFNRAVEVPVAERVDFLRRECADEEIRAELEKMLACDSDDGDTLEGNAFEIFSAVEDKSVPAQIGDYKIAREIGRGGMGVVYEAVREKKNFSQRVALKVIKRGMDTDAILSRFSHEQQILASLVHPNIARFLDGGMTNDGLPFYAMEFVEGIPLDEFTQARNLSINERLELFRQICAAVRFAHKNFVIHRDLKPSNILVTSEGAAKLLDFGIAKILSDEADAAPGTATSLGMMTPAYASPEQVRGERVNTATDVYSLGVILCELLTGAKPYRLSSGNHQELIKAICESEPLKPSAIGERGRQGDSEKERPGDRETGKQKGKKTANNYAVVSLSPRFSLSPLPQVSPSQLRGDLDNIVLKALRKEPENRYESVEQFSEDVRRYLTGMPVIARRSTLKYRAAKFVRRNRLAVVAGLLIFASLVAGVAVASWQAYAARREREIAERRFEDVRELANKVVFKYHDAIAALPGSTETREMLVKDATEYLDRLSQDAQGNPSLAQELALSYLKIGDVQGETYRANLGDSEGALSSYRKSAQILEELTRSQPKTLEYRKNLRNAYRQITNLLVRHEKWQEAANAATRHFDLTREILGIEPDNLEEQISYARAYQVLGDTAEFEKGHQESVRLYRLSLAEAEKLFEKSPANEMVRRVLIVALQRLGTRLEYYALYLKEKGALPAEFTPLYEEAEQLHRRTVELSHGLQRDFPNNHIYSRYISATEINHGTALARVGRGSEGIPLIDNALADLKQIAAADPKNAEAKRDIAECLQYLAFARAAMNESEKAVAANQESIKILEEITSADPSNFEFLKQTHLTFNNTGDILLNEGKLAEALGFYRRGAKYAEKMSAFNKSPQIVVLQSVSDQKIGQALLRIAEEKKSAETIADARENLSKAREKLSALQDRNELGKIYEFRIEQLEQELAKASAL